MSDKPDNNIARQLEDAEKALLEQKRRVAELRRQAAARPVEDHVLLDWQGNRRRLSELFAGKPDLIVVHNMGRSCPYCTLWADGFKGLLPHLGDRAAFVVVSPDAPEVQREFATSRGWEFTMLSDPELGFFADMGFLGEKGDPWPGVSTFRREGDELRRVGRAGFGPGDEFCSAWHFFDLLADGAAGWQPRYGYEAGND